LSQCQQEVQNLDDKSHGRQLIAYRPCCDIYGNYRPLQYDGSTGYSWCVDRLGLPVKGSLSKPGEGMPRCEPIDPTGCQLQVQRILGQLKSDVNKSDPDLEYHCYNDDVTQEVAAGQRDTVDIPECDATTGQYRPMQTDDLSRDRWCVGPEGLELSGTRTPKHLPDPACLAFTPKEIPITKCEREYQEATKDPELIGQFVPQCDEKGNYEPMQCWGSTGTCWCVDGNGTMINGTLTLPGELWRDCDHLA